MYVDSSQRKEWKNGWGPKAPGTSLVHESSPKPRRGDPRQCLQQGSATYTTGSMPCHHTKFDDIHREFLVSFRSSLANSPARSTCRRSMACGSISSPTHPPTGHPVERRMANKWMPSAGIWRFLTTLTLFSKQTNGSGKLRKLDMLETNSILQGEKPWCSWNHIEL